MDFLSASFFLVVFCRASAVLCLWALPLSFPDSVCSANIGLSLPVPLATPLEHTWQRALPEMRHQVRYWCSSTMRCKSPRCVARWSPVSHYLREFLQFASTPAQKQKDAVVLRTSPHPCALLVAKTYRPPHAYMAAHDPEVGPSVASYV